MSTAAGSAAPDAAAPAAPPTPAPAAPVPDDVVAHWWGAVIAAALVGTERAQVPPLPDVGVTPRPGATPETALFDAAALGAVLVRAGRVVPAGRDLAQAAAQQECPPDAAAVAPDAAVQLLRLALTQPPVGKDLQDAVLERWLTAAATHRRRLPHALLPAALTAATNRPALRPPLRAVLDERGRWLAARRADWAWAREEVPAEQLPDDEEWARLGAADRVAALARIRAVDPARGRALVATEFGSVGAKDRAALVGALRAGLGPDDEDLLTTALADKAKAVHQQAAELLDALPGSARARRLGAVLADALTVHGLLRPQLQVGDLPDLGPDVRSDDAPQQGSAGWQPWLLEQAVAGAPLSVLTDATRTDPAGVLRLDRDGRLRAGLRRAVLARGDVAWARAMLAQGWDPHLAAVLPPSERQAVAAAAIRAAASDDAAPASAVTAVPGPWDEAFSRGVLDWCTRATGAPPRIAPLPVPAAILASRMSPTALPAVRQALDAADAAEARAAADVARAQQAAERAGTTDAGRALATATSQLALARHNARALRDLTQFLSFTRSIDEAFS